MDTIRTDEQGVHWALNHFSDCPHADQHRRGDSRAIDLAPSTARSVVKDLRDLPDYMTRNNLIVVGSTITDNGNGRLIIELQTRRLA